MATVKQIALELHVSRRARDTYRIDDAFFALDGRVIFPDFHAARLFAQRLNARRDLVRWPEQAVRAGEINAMGLIVEILHYVIGLYREQINPDVMRQAMGWLETRLGAEKVDAVLHRFLDDFPPQALYRGEAPAQAYLSGATEEVPRRLVLLEELLMLWLENVNPAFAPLLDLFDDADLEKTTIYREVFPALHEHFATQPSFGPERQNLLDMLRAPALAVPHSLGGQLEYIREKWGHLLGERLYKLLSGMDLLREEQKLRELGRGQVPVYRFDRYARALWAAEAVRYSPDRDWMPRLVLVAKSVYVWLDQLGRRCGRRLTRLDEIPDDELDRLARWGFTGIWLIGVWERSRASQRIKQLCGNPEAVASAYALHDYVIADDLGGEAALRDLQRRAWERGMRLAGDMVPNHVGIDGRWVIEHPDWFVGLDHSPYPAYRFEGPDLSPDPRVGIQIEDHYYNRSDAAVVFKRHDRWTGGVRYVYHGNDGTSMPWNDTAQINFLHPEAREAVIRTILHVARLFPIIRFDAAMTIAKRHYQRLWFPEPGGGGDIPSRAGHGLTREQFDAAMPEEFWREVVERAAREAPDTLLLAEAFWLMEGYFVRTLGMHRVYNSAFMNMLKAEENGKYRQSLKNVLEFDPEILKRFVNFMNNPDEETAVAQFGKDDKYFGVCLLLATMPGLPMFGHGQIEGFGEKYGMEYRRAYWDEQPDQELIERHEREIFPLLHRRHLFADVREFLLYDFFGPDGRVNENVFAYSNRHGDERALILYHNKYEEAQGWVRVSAAYAAGGTAGGADEARTLVQKTLADGLSLGSDPDQFWVFRDSVGGLEYIRSARRLCDEGLYVELGAYKSHALLDWRAVRDDVSRRYANLAAYLDGRGVPSIEEALRQTFVQPLQQAFGALVDTALAVMAASVDATRERASAGHGSTGAGATGRSDAKEPAALPAAVAPLLDLAAQHARELAGRAREIAGTSGNGDALAAQIRHELKVLSAWPESGPPLQCVAASRLAALLPAAPWRDGTGIRETLALWVCARSLGRLSGEEFAAQRSRSWIDEWLLGKVMASALRQRGAEEAAAWRAVGMVKLLCSLQEWPASPDAADLLTSLLREDDARQFLQVNRHQGVLWYNREAFEELLGWLLALALLSSTADATPAETGAADQLATAIDKLTRLAEAGQHSGFQVEELLRRVRVAGV